jgi:hypothetical protein
MKKIGLSTAHRERHYLTLKKYCILVAVIWENDWYEFDHEASRVGFSAKMNFYVYSSARLGEVVESSARANTGKGLRYRVSKLCIQPKKSNQIHADALLGYHYASWMGRGWETRDPTKLNKRICKGNAGLTEQVRSESLLMSYIGNTS